MTYAYSGDQFFLVVFHFRKMKYSSGVGETARWGREHLRFLVRLYARKLSDL